MKIAYKNHKHSVNNPYSQFRDVYTEEQIAKSPVVHEPLTKLQACSQGAPMLTLSRSRALTHASLRHPMRTRAPLHLPPSVPCPVGASSLGDSLSVACLCPVVVVDPVVSVASAVLPHV